MSRIPFRESSSEPHRIPFREFTLLPLMDATLLDENSYNGNAHLVDKALVLGRDPKPIKERLYKAKAVYIHAGSFNTWSDILIVLHRQRPLPLRVVLISGTDCWLDNSHMEAVSAFFPNTQFFIRNWMGDLPNCTVMPIGTMGIYEGPPQEKKYMFGISYVSNNGPMRQEFYDYLASGPDILKYTIPKCGEQEFYGKLAKLRFSTCPMGCGFDTLRFWECLVVGCIPIVKDDPFYDVLIRHYPGLPMIRVKKWEDLPSVVDGLTEELYEELMAKADITCAWESYWLPKIESLCKEEVGNGTHSII
jgi:hypothetical protein